MTQLYSITHDFNGDPQNLNEFQLKTEIQDHQDITKTCLNVGRDGNIITITFDQQLTGGEIIVLDGIVERHIPIQKSIISEAYVEPNSTIIKHLINGVPHQFLGTQTNEIHISKCTQGQFSSLKAAILANNTPNTIFIMYPGIYIEDNPIILPANCVIRCSGTPQNTVIQAQNNFSDIIRMGVGSAIIGCGLAGASFTGSRGIYFDATQSGGYGVIAFVLQCFIEDCDIGIECDAKNIPLPAAPDILYCNQVLIRSKTQTCSKGFYIHAAASLTSTNCFVIGYPPVGGPAKPILRAIDASGNATKISMTSTVSRFNTVGLYLDDNVNASIILINIESNGSAIHVGSSGVNTTLIGSSIDIKTSSLYDINVEAADAKIDFASGCFDGTKIRNVHDVKLNIRYNTIKFGRYFQTMMGEIQFGAVETPTKVSIGEGQYITDGSAILSNSNLEVGSWVDLTSNMNNYVESNIFNGTGVDNCFYVGCNYNIPGLKVDVSLPTSGIVDIGDVRWEYWNGTDWVRFHIMTTFADYPCYTYIKSFMSTQNKFHLRFGNTTATPFAMKTLAGYSKKWIRLRLVNAIPSIPKLKYIKIHVNSKLINSDGFTEFFGNSRPVLNNLTNLEIHYPANSTLIDGEFFTAQNLSFVRTKCILRDNQMNRVGMRGLLPVNIDSSFPLKIEFIFVCNGGLGDGSQNIHWKLRYMMTKDGDDIFMNVNDAPLNASVITLEKICVVGGNNKHMTEVFELPICMVDTNASDGKSNLLWVSLERDAGVGNVLDTYGGSVGIIVVKSRYVSWCVGGHILSF